MLHEEFFIISVVCELIEVRLLLHAESELSVHRRVHGSLLKELLVDVACVFGAPNRWLERNLHLLFQHLIPVEALEENMIFDIFRVCLRPAQSF